MTKSLKSLQAFLFTNKLLSLSFCLFALISCSSLPKPPPLHSENLIFKIKWTYSSPPNKKQSFDSFVFIQGDHLLRIDILRPFIGLIASLVLNHETLILQAPLKKIYYKGKFNSKSFFPDLPFFPGTWIISLLRAQAEESWNCHTENKKISYCKTDHFEIKWMYKKSRLETVQIKDLKQRQIKAQIRNFFSKENPPKMFKPSLKDLKRQKDPLFFQKL